MKKFLIVFLILFCISNAKAAVSDNPFERFSTIISIKAQFKSERFVQISKKPLISRGNLYFKRPNKLKWEYINPIRHSFVFDGSKTFIEQYDDKGVKTLKDISKQREAKAAEYLNMFVGMDASKIGQYYDIKAQNDGVLLYPKDNSSNQIIEYIQISFSKKIAAVSAVEIFYKNGDKTVISFTDIILNQNFADDIFNV
jgi:outer membrane lipoprotein-sorting protein